MYIRQGLEVEIVYSWRKTHLEAQCSQNDSSKSYPRLHCTGYCPHKQATCWFGIYYNGVFSQSVIWTLLGF